MESPENWWLGEHPIQFEMVCDMLNLLFFLSNLTLLNFVPEKKSQHPTVQSQLLQILSNKRNPTKSVNTLQGTNISYLGKRKIIFKSALVGDMLVPGRVTEFVVPKEEPQLF